jgi:hypothetical protein
LSSGLLNKKTYYLKMMNTREALGEILQISKGMNSEDAKEFVTGIGEYTRKE